MYYKEPARDTPQAYVYNNNASFPFVKHDKCSKMFARQYTNADQRQPNQARSEQHAVHFVRGIGPSPGSSIDSDEEEDGAARVAWSRVELENFIPGNRPIQDVGYPMLADALEKYEPRPRDGFEYAAMMPPGNSAFEELSEIRTTASLMMSRLQGAPEDWAIDDFVMSVQVQSMSPDPKIRNAGIELKTMFDAAILAARAKRMAFKASTLTTVRATAAISLNYKVAIGRWDKVHIQGELRATVPTEQSRFNLYCNRLELYWMGPPRRSG
jgi:hypothetical protein